MSDKALMGEGGGKNGEARKAPSPIEEIAIAALQVIVELNRCGACDGRGELRHSEDPTPPTEDDLCIKCGGTGFKQIGGGTVAQAALRAIGELEWTSPIRA